MAAKLTERQKRFCDEYLFDLNATQAAIRAGYSEKTAQNIWKENLTKPYIKKRIEARIAEKESQLIATQDVVLRYLTSVMRSKSTASLLPSCGVGVQHVIAKHPDEKISIHAPRGGCDSKTVHFLAHFADIRRKKSHIFRKTKRRFILIGRKCCFLTLFRVRTSREIPVRLHFAAYTRSVSVGK